MYNKQQKIFEIFNSESNINTLYLAIKQNAEEKYKVEIQDHFSKIFRDIIYAIIQDKFKGVVEQTSNETIAVNSLNNMVVKVALNYISKHIKYFNSKSNDEINDNDNDKDNKKVVLKIVFPHF